MDRTRRHRHLAREACVVAAAIVISACGSPAVTGQPSPAAGSAAVASSLATVPAAPSPLATSSQTAGPTPSVAASASPSPASSDGSQPAVYAQIEAQVVNLRELSSSGTLAPTLLTEAGVRDDLTKLTRAQLSSPAFAAYERLLKHLGLLPESASLAQTELDLLASQVIGRYDPQTKQLYIVSNSGGVGPLEKLIFSHEFTHALQDQHFDLARVDSSAPDQDDRDLARAALVEGDATLSMTVWASSSLDLSDLLGMLAEAMGPSQDLLDSAPAILRETLSFPYQEGLAFIQGVYTDGGWDAVDRLYANPPASTSQILHPELYAAGVQPESVAAPSVPASLAGWKLAFEDTLGEEELGIWLAGANPSSDVLSSGAAHAVGWGGDRVGLYEGPNGGWAVVVRTSWRSSAAAGTFRSALSLPLQSVEGRSDVCPAGPSPNEVRVVIATDLPTARLFC